MWRTRLRRGPVPQSAVKRGRSQGTTSIGSTGNCILMSGSGRRIRRRTSRSSTKKKPVNHSPRIRCRICCWQMAIVWWMRRQARGREGTQPQWPISVRMVAGMFHATSAEYNSPFLSGNKDGSLTPEQRALPGSVSNPTAGLVIVGGIATAGLAPEIIAGGSAGLSYAQDLFAAYKAAQAGYSLTTAAATGAAVSGATYTGGAVAGDGLATLKGNNFYDSFNQNFSLAGLATATKFGAYNSMFTTSMLGWAGIQNSIMNITTIPEIVIRGIGLALSQTAGKAAQAIVKSGEPQKQ